MRPVRCRGRESAQVCCRVGVWSAPGAADTVQVTDEPVLAAREGAAREGAARIPDQPDAAGRPAGPDRWAHLLEVLGAHPEAHLNALAETGLFVPVPPALQALGHGQLLARSGIESVEPDDHELAVAAWLAMLEDGHAATELRDLSHPLHLTRIEFFDLRAEHGVVGAVAFRTGLRPVLPAAGDVPAHEGPRIGRVCKDYRALIISADRNAEEMLGRAAGALAGVPSRDLLHPDDQELAVASWIGLLARPGEQERVRLRHRRADGSWLWVDVVNHNRLEDPAYGCIVADLVDVSREMAFREDVRAQERLLRRLTQALPVGVVQLSRVGAVVYTNERLHEVLAMPARGSLEEQLQTLRAGDSARLLTACATALRSGLDDDLQVEVLDAGSNRVLEVAVRPLLDEGGVTEGVLLCLNDVTESVRLRAELEQRATHDVLTGCLNRGAVLRRLQDELGRAGPGRGCAVLFLDLDAFKRVNDTAGHAAGDEVLREVAAVLRSAARTGDAVGRLGGDEFVLVCPRIATAEQALALAVDVQARLRRSHPSGARPSFSASTGVAWVDDPALDAETVLARADAAMYGAKNSPEGGAVLWSGDREGPAVGTGARG